MPEKEDVYFHLNIPFFQATLPFMLCILFFGIVWFFGCPKNLSLQVCKQGMLDLHGLYR